MRTESLFNITFDGEQIISRGDFFADEEFSFPMEFPGEIKPLVSSMSPAVRSYGNISSRSEFTVVRKLDSPAILHSAWYDRVLAWRTKGKGVFTIELYGNEMQFEAIIKSYNPRMVIESGKNLLYEEYGFELGKML